VSVAAVVLAAGAATRYGSPKQNEFLPAVLAALAEANVPSVVIVEGAHALEPGSEPGSRVLVVHCDDWADGPGASLRCGLGALGHDVTHALVVLADGPQLDPRAVRRVVDHRADADVIAASYDGSRSHPVILARAVWDAIPDAGARALEPVLVDCSDLRPPGDVDYPDRER
jgi:CTP:molybdopterin cytidylyltransferase MocA